MPGNENINSVSSNTAPAPTSADPSTAGNAASANVSDNYTAATKIGTLAELKKRAPKLYNAMMMGIAQSVCRDMQDHAERLKSLMREGSR